MSEGQQRLTVGALNAALANEIGKLIADSPARPNWSVSSETRCSGWRGRT